MAVIGPGPPPLRILLAEWPRGAWNMASLALAWPRLGEAPRGDGRPVLVLPGLVNSDRSNFAMRAFLRRTGPATATNVWRAFEWLTGEKIADPAVLARQREAGEPLAVPATAIWSRSDGLVNGLICRDEQDGGGGMEVRSSHIFVQFNPHVLRALAQALADQRGSGSPAR